MSFNIVSDEHTLVRDKEAFLEIYPPTKWGNYRPQPCPWPTQYPCLIKEISIEDNPNGADTAILNIEYDFTEKEDG